MAVFLVTGCASAPFARGGKTSGAAAELNSAMRVSEKRVTPRGRSRILYVSDPSSIAQNVFADPVREQDLRQWVNMLADSSVDMLNQEVYSQGWTVYWRSQNIGYDQRLQHKRFIPLLDAGIQPLNVLIEQAHKRGMVFIAGFRINDNHSFLAKAQGVGISKLLESHPEWILREYPPGEAYKLSVGLDFTFDGVRDRLLKVIEEVVTRFEVEGIELCFRDHAYFPVNKGLERSHLMTDLVQKVRAMLDQHGKAKNQKLLLGARVFQTLNECRTLGLDVPTWISKGMINYLSPADVMFTDFNAPYDEFAALTRNSTCMLYPGMLPWSSVRARGRLDQIPLSPSSQRAFAHTVYGAGGDGISLYNHFSPFWNAPFYPQALRIFRELRDPQRVAAGERHYIFDPTWTGVTGFGADGLTSTGVMKANKLVLDRSAENSKGEYILNFYEDMEQTNGATLLFRGFGLTDDDGLEIRFNGSLIPDSEIRRTRASKSPTDWHHVHQVEGRAVKTIPEQGRIDFRKQPEPSFSTRWFELKGPLVKWGKNSLSVTLVKSDPLANDQIVIDEIEIWVQPR